MLAYGPVFVCLSVCHKLVFYQTTGHINHHATTTQQDSTGIYFSDTKVLDENPTGTLQTRVAFIATPLFDEHSRPVVLEY